MKNIKLVTKTGEYVTTITIPKFTIMPKCICWGNRYFFKYLISSDYDTYVEDTIWYVHHTSEDSINE